MDCRSQRHCDRANCSRRRSSQVVVTIVIVAREEADADETAVVETVVKVDEMAVVKISVHKDTAARPNKGPATVRTSKSKATTRPNGKAPGATAKRVATEAVASKAVTTKTAATEAVATEAVTTKAAATEAVATEPATTKAVTTKTATAKPATSVACFSQRNRNCHRESGDANREYVLQLFHRATRFFVLRRTR